MTERRKILYIANGMDERCFSLCYRDYFLERYFDKVVCFCNPNVVRGTLFKPIVSVSKSLMFMEPGMPDNITRASIRKGTPFIERTFLLDVIYSKLEYLKNKALFSTPYLLETNKESKKILRKLIEIICSNDFKDIKRLYPNHHFPTFEDPNNDLILKDFHIILTNSMPYTNEGLVNNLNGISELFKEEGKLDSFTAFLKKLISPKISLKNIKDEIKEILVQDDNVDILVIGFSYGGYMAAKITELLMKELTDSQLERFACVTMGAMHIPKLSKEAPFVNYKSRHDIVNLLPNTKKNTVIFDLLLHPNNTKHGRGRDSGNKYLIVNKDNYIVPREKFIKINKFIDIGFYIHSCVTSALFVHIISNYFELTDTEHNELANKFKLNLIYPFYKNSAIRVKNYKETDFSFDDITMYDNQCLT